MWGLTCVFLGCYYLLFVSFFEKLNVEILLLRLDELHHMNVYLQYRISKSSESGCLVGWVFCGNARKPQECEWLKSITRVVGVIRANKCSRGVGLTAGFQIYPLQNGGINDFPPYFGFFASFIILFTQK